MGRTATVEQCLPAHESATTDQRSLTGQELPITASAALPNGGRSRLAVSVLIAARGTKPRCYSKPGGRRKEEKLAREKAKFIESIAAGTHNTVQTRVAWVLNRYPAARNSDVTLQVTYWRTFDRQLLAGPNAVALENLYQLTRLTDIARARAKIQNEYGLFLAADNVKRRRIAKDAQERVRQVEDQPGLKTITVYSDETGKNEDHLIVGTVWFLDGMDVYQFTEALKDLRKERGFKDELHFTRIRDQNLDSYLAVLDLLDKYASTISFRAIMIRRRDTVISSVS